MQVDDSPALRKTMAALRPVCAQLPGSEEYVMVHHPAFRVAKKPFLIVGMAADTAATTISINLGRETQGMLLSDARFTRTPYIGQHGWVTVTYTALRAGEAASLVEDSWRRVANKKQLAARSGTEGTNQTVAPRKAAKKAGNAKAKAKPAKRKASR